MTLQNSFNPHDFMPRHLKNDLSLHEMYAKLWPLVCETFILEGTFLMFIY